MKKPMDVRASKRWSLALAMLLAGAVGPAQGAVQLSASAPDFTLRSVAGNNLRLAEQRGQVVLVNFWATWCGPCRQEMPHLNRIYDTYRASGFVLLGVNIDDDPRLATELASKLGLKFPVLLDGDKKVSRVYDMSAMPATLLIDRDGRVRHIHRGYRDGVEKTYEEQVRALLKE
ncbi:MAG: TlpA disulfide reductase family protein [Burkholderiaceae bacterium]